ncbi:MAG TPA: radical SAM protein, partial [Gemmatimonadaceae bacterium]|nr:radical SAM protein [Gemmatimonadaceae bacterium]
MLAPIDKLERGGNRIIQIEVTRICTLNCSNCTRLLPFRRDEKHMGVDVFREAVRSLADWPGVIGIFGGNPPCHPRFGDLMAILVEEIPDQRHRGLWANDLLKHGELVRDVFYPHGMFNLNAHAD